jgi:hypothetical protein
MKKASGSTRKVEMEWYPFNTQMKIVQGNAKKYNETRRDIGSDIRSDAFKIALSLFAFLFPACLPSFAEPHWF